MNRLHLSNSLTGILANAMSKEERRVVKFANGGRVVEEVLAVAGGRADESDGRRTEADSS